NSELFVFSLYNPPNVLLNFEFFKTVNKKCRNYILGGDLNARTKQIGCVGENENGIMLERIINELDFSVINDKLSSSLIDKITDFSVLNSQDMTSDHFPIEASISMGYQLENKSEAKREILYSQIVNITESSLTIDQLNDKITEKIISASHKSIPYLSKKIYKTSLPPNIVNLIKERRKLKNEAASGPDQIHNLMLKNLPGNSLIEIIELFNLSLREASSLQDPLNYRPISISSCLGKLLERIVYSRLYNILEQNSLLIQEQSGFRKHRRTADNLFFLIQKIVESFNRKKRVSGLFFDISKAFDRVWHEGLLFKLIKINQPHFLTNWIRSFLDSRTFEVNVNDHLSEEYQITAGVPQGSVISPLLFSIYINDIPKRNKTNNEYSLLFADDLVTFFIHNKKGNLENKIKKNKNEVEQWLIKWKMKISIEKSCSVVFSRYKKESDNLNLKIYGNRIVSQKEIKFLGIKFDSKLNFNILVDEIKERCINRLNIIKILSNKKWGLNQNTLGNLYKSLVG
ncbi:RNA-directed DNA polymerase from mobile element, partial [Brachionus plicatilis]